jgi:site-specific recombinase XerD
MLFLIHTDNWIGYKRNEACNGDLSHNYVDLLLIFNHKYWGPMLSHLEIHEINQQVIQEVYNKMHSFNLSKGYIQLVMRGLRVCLADACNELQLEMPKFPKMKAAPRSKVPTVLNESQQDHVLKFVPKEHKPIVMALFYHGLRMCEACDLKQKDFNCIDGTLTVRTRKEGMERVVLIENKLLERLKLHNSTLEVRYAEELIFSNNGEPYTRGKLYKIIKRALKQAGHGDMTPNMAGRHSAATNYLRRGASTREVQYLLGHSSVRTTERYTHPIALDQARFKRD